MPLWGPAACKGVQRIFIKSTMAIKYSSSERGTRPIITAHISACGGDRKDALLRTISGSIPVDAISGDYLAELNLAWLSTQLADDDTKGYEQ
jgi:hypothetical protein